MSFNDIDYYKSSQSYEFKTEIYFTSIVPNVGFIETNTEITVSGIGYIENDSLKCKFGDVGLSTASVKISQGNYSSSFLFIFIFYFHSYSLSIF